MRFLRKIYDWVLSWAETPYGTVALVLLAFSESSFFPIPPDVLLIALCLGHRKKAFYFAAMCSVASAVGGLAGYGIGYGLWELVGQWFFDYVPGFTPEHFEYVQHLYERYDFWIVFTAAFTPIPYKVITITAGVFGVNIFMFTIASIVGRSARFFLVSWLLHRYGAPVKDFIDRKFNLVTAVFTLLLLGGFILIKLLA